MARSGRCKACGAVIRPRAKDMSVGAASRLHYWRHHPEIMLAGQTKQAPRAKDASRAKDAAKPATRRSTTKRGRR